MTAVIEDTTTLDISSKVRHADYRQALQSLLDSFELWRQENRWCSEFYTHFVTRLSATFTWDPYGTMTSLRDLGYNGKIDITIPAGRSPAERAADLRDIRGRMLQYAVIKHDYLTPERLGRFLAAARLPGYVPPEVPPEPGPATRRFYVEAAGYIQTALTEEQIQAALAQFRERLSLQDDSELFERVTPTDRPRRNNVPLNVPAEERTPLLGRRY